MMPATSLLKIKVCMLRSSGYDYDAYLLINYNMYRILSKQTYNLLATPRRYFSEISKFQNSFLSTTNIEYIENLYENWLNDKKSVSSSFAAYFELLQQGNDPHDAFQHPTAVGQLGIGQNKQQEIARQLKMRLMIDTYRSQGHQFAKVDPLNLFQNKQLLHGMIPESQLSTSAFGYQAQELSQKIVVRNLRGQGPDKDNGPYTIKQFEDWLKTVYCDKTGFQYMHLLNKEERDFIKQQLQEKIEQLQRKEPTKQEQLSTLYRLAKDQTFVDFLGSKFANYKRFGIQGLNSGTTALGQLVESAASHGVENILFGMAHRGRLNALHCMFQKPAQLIFKQFFQKSAHQVQGFEFSGDVKYHLGYSHRRTINNQDVTLTILANPSHLQAVNPLVYGSARAIQEVKNSKQKVLGVIIHGDAAVAGQGIVWQSLQFQDLIDYSPGGIIHIVLNNQIGFTTPPNQSRSSFYCTQIAKAVDAPIIHVNADQPDILDKCMKIAVAYRQKFQKDIFIDIVGYRRHGHNQQDQPTFTQPLMYQKIRNHPTTYEIYSKKLLAKGVINEDYLKQLKSSFTSKYQEDYQKVIHEKFDHFPIYDNQISKIKPPTKWGPNTGVPHNVLTKIFENISSWPGDFNIHPTIKRIYEERIKSFKNKQPLDWATMQKLAWASLLQEGYSVRVSGQDVERGTFSHRHALISDQNKDTEKHVFLKTVSNNVRITNSHLSQYSVLGFQYGYSITNPNCLVIWEAQFGDFANGAAIIIDNFIVSGESKWQQQSGIVLSLPHGMDGQGPQHSQGRIERFLQLSDDRCDQEQKLSFDQQMRNGNLQVIYCSTTSNYFHALRRQIHRDYRKPLIAFNSKKLLKFKGANQQPKTIEQNTNFVPVYGDSLPANQVKKVLICSGQFYYDLKAKRQELNRKDIAIVRIQQLAPFPHQALKEALSQYGQNVEYYWAQQQHQNYGPWNYVYPRLKLSFKKKVGYYGRHSSASTAVGALKLHKKQQEVLMKAIFEY